MTIPYPTSTVEIALADDPTSSYYDGAFVFDALAYYRMGEASGTSFADSSGAGRTATAHVPGTSLVYSQPGALTGDANTAVTFPGGTGGGAFLQATMPTLTTNSWTVEMFFKRAAGTAGTATGILFELWDGVTASMVAIGTDNIIKFHYSSNGTTVTTTQATTATITDTSWHHLAADANGRVHVDGVRVSSVAVVTPTMTTPVLFIGGAGIAPFATGWNGDLDEFTLYPAILTTTQVVAHYAARAISNPTTWTDVSSYYLGGSTQRGRQAELDSMDAGKTGARLRNTDRRFDPTNTAGPYYGTLKPMRRLRIKHTIDAVTYTTALGFVERWPRRRTGPTWAEVNLSVIDGFEQLARASAYQYTAAWPSETPGARINRVLDQVLWPVALRNIDTGTATIPASDGLEIFNALDHIKAVADADLGYFFISADGLATFHDRYHRLRVAASTTSQATFGEADSAYLPYDDLVPDFSEDHVLNDVTSTRDGGAAQQVEDGASIVQNFRRSSTRTPLVTTDADALAQSALIVRSHKDPVDRIEQIVIRPTTSALWAQVLGREIGDRITVREAPVGGGAVNSGDYFIENVQHDFPRSQEWLTTWQLTPVSAGTSGWILDDPYLSVLDSTTVLG